jgi:hypothetical protein
MQAVKPRSLLTHIDSLASMDGAFLYDIVTTLRDGLIFWSSLADIHLFPKRQLINSAKASNFTKPKHTTLATKIEHFGAERA